MTEIPEDIMKAAKEATRSWKGSGELEMNIAKALLVERERFNMNDKMVYRLAYAALASIDAPRTGFHLQPAIEAIKQEYAAIRQGQAKEGEGA